MSDTEPFCNDKSDEELVEIPKLEHDIDGDINDDCYSGRRVFAKQVVFTCFDNKCPYTLICVHLWTLACTFLMWDYRTASMLYTIGNLIIYPFRILLALVLVYAGVAFSVFDLIFFFFLIITGCCYGTIKCMSYYYGTKFVGYNDSCQAVHHVISIKVDSCAPAVIVDITPEMEPESNFMLVTPRGN